MALKLVTETGSHTTIAEICFERDLVSNSISDVLSETADTSSKTTRITQNNHSRLNNNIVH